MEIINESHIRSRVLLVVTEEHLYREARGRWEARRRWEVSGRKEQKGSGMLRRSDGKKRREE